MSATAAFLPMIEQFRSQMEALSTVEKIGHVAQVTGLVIESDGPNVTLGEVCKIISRRQNTEIRR